MLTEMDGQISANRQGADHQQHERCIGPDSNGVLGQQRNTPQQIDHTPEEIGQR